MNLYLSPSHVETWSECWRKCKPDTYLTLYDEGNDSGYFYLEDLILRCPRVYGKLVANGPTVLLTCEREKTRGTSLIFPTATKFLEDTVYELARFGESLEEANDGFLSDAVEMTREALKRKGDKVDLNLFLLGQMTAFEAFDAWKTRLQRWLKGKSSLVEIRIYLLNEDRRKILPLCDGLSVLNLKRDPHLRYTVFTKLRYMFVRSHASDCTGPCKLVSAIGRIVYLEADAASDSGGAEGSCFKLFTQKRQIEIPSYDHTVYKQITEDLTHRLACKICMRDEMNVLYLPCKHMLICMPCHSETVRRATGGDLSCSACRSKVTSVLRCYLV